jgi:hypothetical protein
MPDMPDASGTLCEDPTPGPPELTEVARLAAPVGSGFDVAHHVFDARVVL